MKKLFYVRHGETELNAAGLFSGQIETALTEAGKVQARTTGQKLKAEVPKIDYLVCSPLSRAHETAKIIAEEIGYPINDIELNSLYRERAFGDLENTPVFAYTSNPAKYREIDSVPGAESVEQLQERAAKAFAYAQSIPHDNVLIVAHGAFGRALRRVAAGLPYTDEYNALIMIGNAEIVELV